MSHRQLLSRATEGTDAPTPGYLLVDLAKAANANPAASQDMATYLSRRLSSKSNPNIKAKCCKVMARLCQTSTSFRRSIAQDTQAVTAIKEAMHFRGTPDAVRGDTPNQTVRTSAKECLDAVYTETPTSEQQQQQPRAMSGVGSQYTSSGGGGYGGVSANYGSAPHHHNSASSSSSRMQGIGNPMFADPRNGPPPAQGIGGVVKEAAEVLGGMIKDPLARNIQLGGERGGVGEPPRHAGSYGGPQVRSSFSSSTASLVWCTRKN